MHLNTAAMAAPGTAKGALLFLNAGPHPPALAVMPGVRLFGGEARCLAFSPCQAYLAVLCQAEQRLCVLRVTLDVHERTAVVQARHTLASMPSHWSYRAWKAALVPAGCSVSCTFA